jgi:hypothetical protein
MKTYRLAILFCISLFSESCKKQPVCVHCEETNTSGEVLNTARACNESGADAMKAAMTELENDSNSGHIKCFEEK